MSQFPATVKAITFSKTGDIDVIEKTDQPFPQQGPGDVILKVRVTTIRPLRLGVTYLVVTADQVEYAGVNFIDTYFRSGLYPVALPAIVGSEAAGVIVALPTDPAVLNHPEFKARGYAIGVGAIAVRITAGLSSSDRLSHLTHTELSRH